MVLTEGMSSRSTRWLLTPVAKSWLTVTLLASTVKQGAATALPATARLASSASAHLLRHASGALWWLVKAACDSTCFLMLVP